jgi:RNA polymerase sigma-70 factor (ECF subfamily)
MDKKTETFLEYKPLLFSIAYHMLGSIDAAEDIVQDTYLKWMEADAGMVRHTKAFLVRMATNQSINYLNSARVQREQYVGVWLPEPLPNFDMDRVHNRIESVLTLSVGVMVLMERLTPQERALFLLKEIFSYDYSELAEIFDKTTDGCRQIFKRAKDNLGNDARRFEVDMRMHEKMLNNFLLAISQGNIDDLIKLLKEDIQLFADGGGKTFIVNNQRLTAFLKPIQGKDSVSRLLLNLVPKFRESVENFRQEIIFTNGLASIVSFSGDEPFGVVSLEPEGEQIRNIYVQTNPEKLKHLKKTL